METKFNFKSQICTTRSQSEALLKLGLKKETADMALVENWDWNEEDGKHFTGEYFERPIDYVEGLRDKWIPAWSLGRLIEMIPVHVPFSLSVGHLCINRERIFYWGEEVVFEWWDNGLTIYDNLISCIEWLIKEGYFNKEYLV